MSKSQCTPLTTEQEREIAERYRGGASIRDLSREYHISRARLRALVAAHNVPIRPSSVAKPLSREQQLLALSLYRQGFGIATIAHELHIATPRAREFLVKSGLTIRTPRRTPPIEIQRRELAASVIDGYAQGKSMEALGGSHGISPSTVRRLLARHGIPVRVWRNQFPTEKLEELRARYLSGESLDSIAYSLHLTRRILKRVLVKAGIPDRHSGTGPKIPAIDIAILRLSITGCTDIKIAEAVGRSPVTVREHQLRLGMPDPRTYAWTLWRDRIRREYFPHTRAPDQAQQEAA